MKYLLFPLLFLLCACEPYVPPEVPGADVAVPPPVSTLVTFTAVGISAPSWTFSDASTTITGTWTRSVTSTVTVQCGLPAGWIVVEWEGVASSVGNVATIAPAQVARTVVVHVVQAAGG